MAIYDREADATRVILVGSAGAAGAGSVVASVPSGALTDKSGTITAGGTAQVAAAANSSRKYLFLQNPTGAPGSLWFSTTATAVAASPSVELVPGASYETGSFVPTGAVSIIGATTGQAFTGREA
jgi:hypothetical protein